MILMVNVPCMFRRLPISFLSRPAKRRLRTGSAAAATRPRSLGCECQSALMPASRLQSLHAGERRSNGHSAEPVLLGPPSGASAWTRLNSGAWHTTENAAAALAADVITRSLQLTGTTARGRCAVCSLRLPGG